MFQLLKKNSVEYLESSALSRCNFLLHAFCTRRGGVSDGNFASLNFSEREGDASDNVRQNWKVIAETFNLQLEQFFVVHQVHGDRILIVDHTNIALLNRQRHQVDAIVTDRPGLAIGIKTADCVPVFLADRARRIIGVVHAGWRGTALNIAAKTVTAFAETFSSRPADMLAVIGPAIGPCCYEVDEAVFNAVTGDGIWESAFIPCREEGKWMLDLPSANRRQLLQAGIPPASVFSSDICTSCRKDIFFSHRGDGGKTGRQINFMMLNDNKTA
jgi:YfiH family protein